MSVSVECEALLLVGVAAVGFDNDVEVLKTKFEKSTSEKSKLHCPLTA